MNETNANQCKLAVIIVNYRTPDLVTTCLRSLEAEVACLPGSHVFVADNDSADGSIELLRNFIAEKEYGAWVTLLELPRNGGFSYGNNEAIRHAGQLAHNFKYYHLLNPDTVVRQGAISELVRFMEEHQQVAVAGSALECPDGSIEYPLRVFPSPIKEFVDASRFRLVDRLFGKRLTEAKKVDRPIACDWVSGASMMIRANILEEVGMLDEKYFLYFDEVDFCWRIRAIGQEVWLMPQSIVLHIEGASTGINHQRARRHQAWYDSRRRFFVKAYGVNGLIAADIMWSIGRLSFNLRRLLKLKKREENHDPAYFAWDLLWGDIKALVTGRVREKGCD